MAVLSQAFHEVGGFDEILLASEDFEFGLKLAQAGWSVQYNSAIQVAHYHHRMSCKEILGSAFASGYRSGLVVQRRYPDKVSWLARLSLRMSHPFFYLVLIFPYALLVSVNHIGEEMRRHPIAWIYTPACVVGRLAYQSGVWFRLLQDRRAGRKKNGDVRQRG